MGLQKIDIGADELSYINERPTCDICGKKVGDGEHYIHFSALAGREYESLQSGTVEQHRERRLAGECDFSRQDAPTGPQRQHEVTVCGDCIGDTPSYQWITGYTRERDRQEQAAGAEAAIRERMRLRLSVLPLVSEEHLKPCVGRSGQGDDDDGQGTTTGAD